MIGDPHIGISPHLGAGGSHGVECHRLHAGERLLQRGCVVQFRQCDIAPLLRPQRVFRCIAHDGANILPGLDQSARDWAATCPVIPVTAGCMPTSPRAGSQAQRIDSFPDSDS